MSDEGADIIRFPYVVACRYRGLSRSFLLDKEGMPEAALVGMESPAILQILGVPTGEDMMAIGGTITFRSRRDLVRFAKWLLVISYTHAEKDKVVESTPELLGMSRFLGYFHNFSNGSYHDRFIARDGLCHVLKAVGEDGVEEDLSERSPAGQVLAGLAFVEAYEQHADEEED